MIIVSVAFVVCWFPQLCYFVLNDSSVQRVSDIFAGYYATVFLSYLYLCMNPFIYAIKHEAVKETLVRLMPWRKRVAVAAFANDVQGRNVDGRNIAGSNRAAARITA